MATPAIGLVSVEVFHHHLMLLGMLEEGLICDILSPLLQSDPLLDFKMFHCMKKQLCPTYHFLSFTLVLAYILPNLLCVGLVGQLSLALPV